MRIATMILAGSVAALVAAAPARAKNAEAHRTEDKSEASSCHAYQQAPDGSWAQLPCQAMGSKAPAQSHSSAKSATETR